MPEHISVARLSRRGESVNPADIKDLVGVSGAVGAGITGVIMTLKAKKERRIMKQEGLMANPHRCKDHEDRIRTVEASAIRYDERIGVIKEDISSIKADVNAILIAVGKP